MLLAFKELEESDSLPASDVNYIFKLIVTTGTVTLSRTN